jgi:protein SCO1
MIAYNKHGSPLPKILKWSLFVLWLLAAHARAEAIQWDGPPKFSDITVLDQDGKHVRFYSDLIKGKTVAINFIYTSCTTVCPTLTAILRQTQMQLADGGDRNIQFISISIDPVNDRPNILKDYASRFDVGPSWTFVTGTKSEIDVILKSLGAYSASKNEHQPLILIGDDKSKKWMRNYGIPSPASIVSIIEAAASKQGAEADYYHNLATIPFGKVILAHDVATDRDLMHGAGNTDIVLQESGKVAVNVDDAAKYFTNLPLITQDGKPVRFYDDMIRGKVVVLNTMYTHCTMICSPMTQNLARVQVLLNAQGAKDVRMISITVDPENDPPTVLKEFASQFHANSQWTFLTGKKENIDWILYKLGAYTETKEEHFSLLIVGNETTGAWMKVFAMAKPEEIVAVVKKVAAANSN